MGGTVSRDRRASSGRIAMAWVWLIVGGLFEVGFTTSLRFVEGFRNFPWTLAFLASVAVSMGLLEFSSRSIPMGTAYAVWGGIGAVGTVLVGILWFQEPASLIRVLLILVIVAAIAGLRLTA
jgi:quaternary ammonium compound-resistance protein SugE